MWIRQTVLWCGLVVAGSVLAEPLAVETTPQAGTAKPNELLKGKLIHVVPMPDGLDQWIIESLRRWGKYTVTGDPQGVDMVFEVNVPRRDTRYRVEGGIPLPERDTGEPQYVSFSVVDWVTQEVLWHALLTDKKPKKGEPEPPPGPRVKLYARKLSPEQLADKLVGELRRFVEQLEQAAKSSAGDKPASLRQ